MVSLDNLGGLLGIRRKKTLADRVQDVAEDVVDVMDRAAAAARDAYFATLTTVTPALAKSGKTAGKTAGKALATSNKAADRAWMRSGKAADRAWTKSSKAADKAADRAQDAYEATIGALGPVLTRSGRVAEDALSKTAERTASGLSAAKGAGAAAGTAVATTGAATAGAVGGFFGGLFRGLWSLTLFLFKAAVVAGIAYAGWQWLQSRQQNQSWSPPPYTPPSAPNGATTFGSTTTPASAVR